MRQPKASISFQFDLAEGRAAYGDLRLARNGAPEATVVVVDCIREQSARNMLAYAADRLAETFDVVRFCPSRGASTAAGELEELAAVVDRIWEGRLPLPVRMRQPLPSHIVLLGYDRGGGESIAYALDLPGEVSGVVSWNGSARLAVGSGVQPQPREDRFDLIGRIGSLRVPLVLVHGEHDRAERLRDAERLAASNSNVARIHIPGGDDRFGTEHPFRGPSAPLEAAIAATTAAIRGMLV